MMQSKSSLMSPAAQQALRMDSTLGSGNFLDRCRAMSSAPQAEFLFLQKPFTAPNGDVHHELSLDTLAAARRSLASWYVAAGVGPGDVVAVCVSEGIAPFLHYLALTSLGAAAALINPAMAPETAVTYIQKNDFALLVLDAVVRESTQLGKRLSTSSLTCKVVGESPGRSAAPELLPAWWPFEHADSSLVMLSHTSGTTGVPKAVRFEHRQFFMGKRARIGTFVEGTHERILSALPQSHSSAISHLETIVLHGVPTLVHSDTVGASVRKSIHEFNPTLVLGFPQTYASLALEGVAAGEFSGVRRWVSMGDAVHQSHIERVLVGSPEARFIDAFGSSELGMALFRKESRLGAIAPRRCVGRPVEVAVVKVLDAVTSEEVGAGGVGLIAVRSPTITPGYWRNPEATERAWRNGYFLSGDVGFLRDGELHLIDRAVDVIEGLRRPLYTLLLEEELQRVSGVCDASVVGTTRDDGATDSVLALLLLDERSPPDADVARAAWVALRDALAAEGAELPLERIVVAIAEDAQSFPLGATGKVQKPRLRKLLAATSDALAQGRLDSHGVRCVSNGTATLCSTAAISVPPVAGGGVRLDQISA